jgi:integrase
MLEGDHPCDLVALHVRDILVAGRVKGRASITQSKTGRPVRFEITETTRQSLERWIDSPEMRGTEFLWPSRFHDSPHISTRQYARILRDWVTSIGLESSAYGTHSMRRTKVAQIYKKTGKLRAVQLLLGHTKMDSTVRYLGVDLDDALTISEGIDL